MIYDIRHVTTFDYGASVKFARCNLRLKPIDWPGQRLDAYTLSVHPAGRVSPARAEAGLANVTRLVVDSPVRHLTIESRSRMTVDRLVPVPAAGDPTLAEIAALARASTDLSAASPATYLYPSPLIPLDHAIADYADATLVDTPPHEAFLHRKGVCQDFAQIMITGLRAAGLPAAYASGYIRTIPPAGQPRLVGADATHAWVLLWCGPVHGWVGMDPTNGIWMASDHIVMAVGRDYAEIAPVDGVVLGSGAQSMDVSVDVAPLDDTVSS
jgi:transglutaminase-like putative cysteine protease